jgi:hypothetical protein
MLSRGWACLLHSTGRDRLLIRLSAVDFHAAGGKAGMADAICTTVSLR